MVYYIATVTRTRGSPARPAMSARKLPLKLGTLPVEYFTAGSWQTDHNSTVLWRCFWG